MNSEKEIHRLGLPEQNGDKKTAIAKLQEELKDLTDTGTLVIDLEKWIEQGRLPLGESGDILVDVLPTFVNDVRDYLNLEKEYTIVKEGPGPRHNTGGGYWFVLKLGL